MIYEITHRTSYAYETAVSAGRCALRLLPSSSQRQSVLASSLGIDPGPAESREIRDFFGNRVVLARIAAAAERHVFEARARVEVHPVEMPHALLTPSVREVAAAALETRSLHGLAPCHALFATPHAPALGAASDYAAPSIAPDRPVLDAALDLMRRIHADFAYDPAATDVSTPLDDVFSGRRGVCQDFAHVMIAALRSQGLPAFYVSGYLRTLPPPGKPRLVGADASHAWVSVWCGPGLGYVDLDPTNSLVVAEDHVTLAVGRDYADIAPVTGVVTASSGHTLRVSVDMAPEG